MAQSDGTSSESATDKIVDISALQQLGLPTDIKTNGDSPLHAGLPHGKERDDKRARVKSFIAQQQAMRSIVLTPDIEKQFWESSAALTHIYQFAMSRGVEPWAAFGSAQSYGVAHIPPLWSFLPELGRRGSANTITLLLDDSGGGKGASTDCGVEAFNWPVFFRPVHDSPKSGPAFVKKFMGPVPPQNPTGQMTVAAAAKTVDKKDELMQTQFTAWFEYPEITNVDAAAAQSLKIIAIMCQAWSSEQLGGSALDERFSMMLEKGKYRLCVLAGVQIENVSMILKHQKTGLPQRALWMPAYSMQDTSKLDEAIDFIGLQLSPLDVPSIPDVTGLTVTAIEDEIRRDQLRAVAMPDHIREIVQAEVISRRYDKEKYSALDRHEGLTKMSQALFLSQLDGFHDQSAVGFTENDYERSEVVLLKSRETRQQAQDALGTQEVGELKDRGRKQYIVRQTEAALNRAEQAKNRYHTTALQLAESKPHEWVTYSKMGIKVTQRSVLKQVLERMAKKGEIEFRVTTPKSGVGETFQVKTPSTWESDNDDE